MKTKETKNSSLHRLYLERKSARLRRLKIILTTLFVVVVVVALSLLRKAIREYLAASNLFLITEISVTPARYQPDVENIIKCLPTRNILFLDLKKLSTQLLSLPGIESLRIRKVLPHRLNIILQLRQAWMKVSSPGAEVFIDRTGYVVPGQAEALNLPLVKGILITDNRVSSSDNFKLVLLNKIEQWYNFYGLRELFDWQEIDLSAAYRIVLTDGSKEIYLCNTEIEKKFQQLKTVLQECARRNIKWQYVDLRFKDPYLKVNHE